eukprot:15030559-Alexandrium_andersonii.AAC.1
MSIAQPKRLADSLHMRRHHHVVILRGTCCRKREWEDNWGVQRVGQFFVHSWPAVRSRHSNDKCGVAIALTRAKYKAAHVRRAFDAG